MIETTFFEKKNWHCTFFLAQPQITEMEGLMTYIAAHHWIYFLGSSQVVHLSYTVHIFYLVFWIWTWVTFHFILPTLPSFHLKARNPDSLTAPVFWSFTSPCSVLLSSSALLTYSLVKSIHLSTQLLLFSLSFAPLGSSAPNLESDFQRCCSTSCCAKMCCCVRPTCLDRKKYD